MASRPLSPMLKDTLSVGSVQEGQIIFNTILIPWQYFPNSEVELLQDARHRVKKKKYVIVAPDFNHKSAGVRMLYFLNDSLNELGQLSIIVPFSVFDKGQPVEPPDDNTIVIYPEVIPHNPLRARNVARYMLNKDGHLTGYKIDRSYRQYFFTYDKFFEPDVFVLYYPMIDHESLNFSDNVEERKLNILYFGKGPALTPLIDGSVPFIFINQEWPEDREQLINFLKLSRFIHLSDPWTSLAAEAMLCGCVPVVHHWGERMDEAKTHMGSLYQIHEKEDYSMATILTISSDLRDTIVKNKQNWQCSLTQFVHETQAFFLTSEDRSGLNTEKV